jgi:hypothetical protein
MIFLLIVTLTSMLLAAIMGVIAWRIAADERRRSEARVAALSMEIHDTAPPMPIQLAARAGEARRAAPPWDQDLELRPGSDAGRAPHLFARSASARPASQTLFAATPARSGSRLFVVLAGGALVLGAVAAMTILGPSRFSPTPGARTPVAIAAAALPLELVALGHERIGDELTVRGVVRNPASGTSVDRLTAVVLLFTSDGGFLTSGRAVVDTPAIGPGGESTFAVTVPRAGDVGRYRVSFRDDDKLIPHLDRRHES